MTKPADAAAGRWLAVAVAVAVVCVLLAPSCWGTESAERSAETSASCDAASADAAEAQEAQPRLAVLDASSHRGSLRDLLGPQAGATLVRNLPLVADWSALHRWPVPEQLLQDIGPQTTLHHTYTRPASGEAVFRHFEDGTLWQRSYNLERDFATVNVTAERFFSSANRCVLGVLVASQRTPRPLTKVTDLPIFASPLPQRAPLLVRQLEQQPYRAPGTDISLQRSIFCSCRSGLLADLGPRATAAAPDIASLSMGREIRAVRAWMSTDSVQATLHYDVFHNAFVQVAGRKHFVLFPPARVADVYLHPSLHPMYRQSQVFEATSPDSTSSFASRRQFPRFPWEEAIRVTVEPGDGWEENCSDTASLAPPNVPQFPIYLHPNPFSSLSAPLLAARRHCRRQFFHQPHSVVDGRGLLEPVF